VPVALAVAVMVEHAHVVGTPREDRRP
jgi:hypothetical protein